MGDFIPLSPQRKQKESVTEMTLPSGLDSAGLLHMVMGKLEISGEVINVKYSADAFDFRVGSPEFVGICTWI